MKSKADILIIVLITLVLISLIKLIQNKSDEIHRFPVKEIKYSPNTSDIKVPILIYHYVEYNPNPADYLRTRQNIAPHIFEEQLQTLKENGYTTIFMKDLADYFDGKKQLPAKLIALTFDDGYRDFYTNVFPLLKKYQIKATIYIIVNFLDNQNFLTKDQLKEIANSGLVEIGSHTMNHIYLKNTNPAAVEEELTQSKKELEDLINKPILDFAYPYGAYDSEAEKLVKEAGYLTATTVEPGNIQSINNRFTLARLRPGNRTGQALILWLDNEEKKW